VQRKNRGDLTCRTAKARGLKAGAKVGTGDFAGANEGFSDKPIAMEKNRPKSITPNPVTGSL
jgi:hypothetical protein